MYFYVVVIGLLYMAYPDGCRHNMIIPVEDEALIYEGALAFVVYGDVV